jgi:2-C-methyl-D-erythritol 4-phosphate cytidylyltransferase/2-C-methyl-D-erythritol 2,4-cyclodiphosphate synthase
MQQASQSPSTVCAIIVAGGSGLRAGGGASHLPKQYAAIGGEPVLRYALRAFLRHERVTHALAVIRPGDEALFGEASRGLPGTLLTPVHGGASRQLSVIAGLRAVAALAPDAVLIHDAARPFVTQTCIGATLDALRDYHGAIAARPVTDTLKRAAAGGRIEATVDRAGLWRAQTPQTFRYAPILKAHEAALAAGRSDFTDDAAIAEWYGLDVAVVDSGSNNMKVTTPEDLYHADLLTGGGAVPDVRSGTGFDVHAFGPGGHVTLCGVKIPHHRGLSGHSDADAGLHALTDALLGTIGAGDIGDHFPPSDPQWRGADSAIFLLHAAILVAERGGRITNADITLICERPKIGPHREAMRARVADLLKLDMERVSLKATTSERLGFTGREEGIACLATATVVFPAGRRLSHAL